MDKTSIFPARSVCAADVAKKLGIRLAPKAELQGFPRWLEEIFYQGTGGIGSGDEFVELYAVLDHKRRSGNIAVCHPYGISDTALRLLDSFSQRHNLRYGIHGTSSYDPRVFRLVIWRPQDYAELEGVVHWNDSWVTPNKNASGYELVKGRGWRKERATRERHAL